MEKGEKSITFFKFVRLNSFCLTRIEILQDLPSVFSPIVMPFMRTPWEIVKTSSFFGNFLLHGIFVLTISIVTFPSSNNIVKEFLASEGDERLENKLRCINERLKKYDFLILKK